jgi:hypothetical protein
MPPAEGAAAPMAVPKSAFEAAAAKTSSEDSSVGRRRSVSAFAASLDVPPATITVEKAVSGVLGIDSIEDIDKDGQFIKVEHLRRLKTIGVGTYAGENRWPRRRAARSGARAAGALGWHRRRRPAARPARARPAAAAAALSAPPTRP